MLSWAGRHNRTPTASAGVPAAARVASRSGHGYCRLPLQPATAERRKISCACRRSPAQPFSRSPVPLLLNLVGWVWWRGWWVAVAAAWGVGVSGG